MIFYDRMNIVCKTKDTDTGPVYEVFNVTVPAIVVPLSSEKIAYSGGSLTVMKYQAVIKPFAYVIPITPPSAAPSKAGNLQYLFTWNGISLSLEGKFERHYLRGRLHHYEFVGR